MPGKAAGFTAGDRIRVVDGPFATFEGVIREVEADADQLRLDVTVKTMTVPCVMHPWQVERAG